jgi:hypothetical protein
MNMNTPNFHGSFIYQSMGSPKQFVAPIGASKG